MVAKTEEQYQAEDDVRTIIRANEIFNDSKRKKQALSEIARQKKATDQAAAQLESKVSKRLKALKGK
jgi:hypothetical protein